MRPNYKSNISLTHDGSFPKVVPKNEVTSVPTAAIICLSIGGYILLMAVALVIRRCLKTSGSTQFVQCCYSQSFDCQCPTCHFCSEFSSLPQPCRNCCEGNCNCWQFNPEKMKKHCWTLMTCGLSSCYGKQDPLCQCGNCNCICTCQLPECQTINCCCFEIRIRS